ncbi:hypothetical protein [Flavobacterium sp. XGLA_31]|uniref:hypothetical protein n=1 Tax=Flavobacterium sp. XGLA_31 TaxID=3447666 RepID=UPI003F34F762
MKKLQYITLIAISLFIFGCDTNDDGFYNNVFVDTSALVTIDPHSSNYTVNEDLYVTVNIPRLITEVGQTNPLDVFQTTGATEFTFSYVIEKQIDALNWEVVHVNDNQLHIEKGNAQNDGVYIFGVCEYNTTNETYEYRVGFPLLNAGTYRMSFGYNSDSVNSVELRSESPNTRLVLNINSAMTGLDNGGYYNFVVN